MPSDVLAVFDLGGTWFRWGHYTPTGGLADSRRARSISYLSCPDLSAEELQLALTDFILQRLREMQSGAIVRLRAACVSIGAPVNMHDQTVLGSGPLWGPTAKPFQLHARLRERAPEVRWHVINDVTALLAPYMNSATSLRKTLLITVSTGVGSRLYDHTTRRIPYDLTYGVQGEIGHLAITFELDGRVIDRTCECGGRNHLNAFCSGRGIAQLLKELPALGSTYSALYRESRNEWRGTDDAYRLNAFKTQLDQGDSAAEKLLDAFVTPLCRTLTVGLSLDPEIDRVVVTGGVAHGLGRHYREALQRAFLRDGLYQISDRDPEYLARRLCWDDPDDFSGLRGAGAYMDITSASRTGGYQ